MYIFYWAQQEFLKEGQRYIPRYYDNMRQLKHIISIFAMKNNKFVYDLLIYQSMDVKKQKKIVCTDWKLVDGSEMKFSEDQLDHVMGIVLRNTEDVDMPIARVFLDQEYADFVVDSNCELQPGDLIDPKSIRVYILVNKEGIKINRLWGSALKVQFGISVQDKVSQKRSQLHKNESINPEEEENSINPRAKSQPINLRAVSVNTHPLIDYSGDDLSLNPVFW